MTKKSSCFHTGVRASTQKSIKHKVQPLKHISVNNWNSHVLYYFFSALQEKPSNFKNSWITTMQQQVKNGQTHLFWIQ